MNSGYTDCSLYLCPGKHDLSAEDTLSLVSALQTIGFIAGSIDQAEKDHYHTGERFLDYVAYMGCAPAIQFEASDSNSNFCFIKIHKYESARLIYSQKQARDPQCPDCKKSINNWLANKTDTQIECKQCGTRFNIEDLNWRKMAGYARLFIEITDIFPKEAIPQQSLLENLADISGSSWSYFYSCS